jgi:hypothetical protein
MLCRSSGSSAKMSPRHAVDARVAALAADSSRRTGARRERLRHLLDLLLGAIEVVVDREPVTAIAPTTAPPTPNMPAMSPPIVRIFCSALPPISPARTASLVTSERWRAALP